MTHDQIATPAPEANGDIEPEIGRPKTGHHVCPVWVGRLLASPVRRLLENPIALVSPYVRSGMTVLDAGPAMGFFSLPMARLVGRTGRVVCVDLQQGMLDGLDRRARRRGLNEIIESRRCSSESLELGDLTGVVDFALAFHVVHETPAPDRFLAEIFTTLRPGGRMILAEPIKHVDRHDRGRIFALAEHVGFARLESLSLRSSEAALYGKG